MRLRSVDMFRGITIVLMLFVNSMNDSVAYSWSIHASWNGCTLADLVFPFFIFIAGVSAALAISAMRQKGLGHKQIVFVIMKRTVYLFLIGLLLNAYPKHFDWASLRWLGVLQRIALCYCCSAMLFLYTNTRTQIIIAALSLVGYYCCLMSYPLTAFDSFSTHIDRLLIPAAHLFRGGYDPEGLFSTIPAVATALTGTILAAWLLKPQAPLRRFQGILCIGILLAVCGWLWHLNLPFNKTIWSSSYVLWTSGISLIIYALCYWLIEIKQYTCFHPLIILGKQAMFIFVAHVLYLKTQVSILAVHGLSPDEYINGILFNRVSQPNASVLFGLLFTGFWWCIAWLRYSRVIALQRGKYHIDAVKSLQ